MSFDEDWRQTHYLGDGVYGNYNCPSWGDDDDEIKAQWEREKRERKIMLLCIKAGTTEELRRRLFNEIIKESLKEMAFRYCFFEKLSREHAVVGLQDKVLFNIVEQYAVKLDILLNHQEVDELFDLLYKIYRDVDGQNVYSRVGLIQDFIHSKAIIKHGKNADMQLDKEIMRQLLSLSRLHIGVSDLRRGNINIISNEILKNKIELDKKEDDNLTYVIKSKKRYIKNWKYRHHRSLLFYASEIDRDRLNDILRMDITMSIEEAMNLLINEWNYC